MEKDLKRLLARSKEYPFRNLLIKVEIAAPSESGAAEAAIAGPAVDFSYFTKWLDEK